MGEACFSCLCSCLCFVHALRPCHVEDGAPHHKCLRTAPEAGALVRFSALRRSGDMRAAALWLLASLCCCCLQPASCSIRGWLKGVAEGALNRGKAIGE